MAISLVDPLTPAIEHTKEVLFRPFDLSKWLALGFCAWLAGLGEGGGGGAGGGGRGGGGGRAGGLPDFGEAHRWLLEHLAIVVAVGLAACLLLFAIALLVNWLSSRGRFMFLDGVVRNRGAVVEPWREFRREGNSLFWFRLCLGLAAFLLFLAIVAGGVAAAWPDLQSRRFGPPAVVGLLVSVPSIVVLAIAVGCVGVLVKDFVVPIMYLRRLPVLAAWREFHRSLLIDHQGTFVLYILFRILMAMAASVLTLAACCLTCCLVLLPYVGTVILLPLLVFLRTYPLCFLEQFGPKWRVF